MTRDEYQGLTNYNDPADAKDDLASVKLWFGAMAVSGVLHALAAWNISRPFPGYTWYVNTPFIILLLAFVWFCYSLKQRVKLVSKAALIFTVAFAPLGWFMLYAQLIEPLEIIIGIRLPPKESVDEWTKRSQEIDAKSSSNVLKTVGWAFLISTILLGAMLYLMISMQS